MADLRKLKDKAAEHLARGRFAKAAEALAAVVKADRRDIASHQKLGEALRRAGQTADALRVYEDVADRYAADGQLIKAVAICKVILEMDRGHARTQEMLADLYARKQVGAPLPWVLAPAAGGAVEEPAEQEEKVEIPLAPAGGAREIELPDEDQGPPAAAEAALSAAATPFEAILGAARESAGEEEVVILTDPTFDEPLEPPARPGHAPAAEPAPRPSDPAAGLPRVPLFSDLPREAFVALTGRVALHRAQAGATILAEGDAGTSFFVVASGAVRVEKKSADGGRLMLARLAEGSFFGEMAILSGEPRAASVVAEGDCEFLEIRADVLLDLVREHPRVVESLARFYRRRLLANAMATSPLFRPFSREDRTALMARFRTREVVAGTEVIAEGEPADGLYVVLSGALDVWKRRDGTPGLAGRLREGDVFGEMSCLRKGPASATVMANRRCLLLRLPRSTFDELVVTYPQILELISELTDERQRDLEAIAAGQAAFGEDGMLLT